MKTYSVRITVQIHDKATTYPEVRPIDFEIRENLPADVDPQKYVRQRLHEELTRHFNAISTPIENKDEAAPPAPAPDPLF